MSTSNSSTLDIDFLAEIYEILKCIERESNDTSGKRTEESCLKITEFHKKLDQVRHQISVLPGIEFSKQAQVQKFEALQEQLILKKKLLRKYKEMVTLEGSNLKQYLGN